MSVTLSTVPTPISGAITSISLVPGGSSVHVTVYDNFGNVLLPYQVTWNPDPQLNPITSDATGFLFSAPLAESATPTAPLLGTKSFMVEASVVVAPGGNPARTGLLVEIAASQPATSLQFTSP